MDKKQLYTSISRTTKHEYVHINNNNNNCLKTISTSTVKQPILELTNTKFNSLYQNGKI